MTEAEAYSWQRQVPTAVLYFLAAVGLLFSANMVYEYVSGTVLANSSTPLYTRATRKFLKTPDTGVLTEDAIKHGLFRRLGMECNTDKVTVHSYEGAYERYLWQRRKEHLNFLEIGLGCDMPYGAGHSLCAWKKYLPNARMSILEYQAACAANFTAQIEGRMFTGDQANLTLLAEIAAAGPYDVLVDDGGHSWRQQRNSFAGLFPALKPGGLYFLEDLETSFLAGWADAADKLSTADFIKNLLDSLLDKHVKEVHPEAALAALIDHVDCFHELCVFTRNSAPAPETPPVDVEKVVKPPKQPVAKPAQK